MSRGRGRPRLPRDEHGRIIRPNKPEPQYIPERIEPIPENNEIQEEIEEFKRQQRQKKDRKPGTPIKPENDYFYLSAHEYMQDALAAPIWDGNTTLWNQHKTEKGDPDWFGLPGSHDMASITAIVNDGWTDGAARLSRLSDQLELPPVISSRRKLAWMDEGDEFCHQRLYSGDVDTMWRRPVRASHQGPSRIRIGVQIGANCGISGEAFFWPGACAVAMADILENAGHRVEVVGVQINDYHRAAGKPFIKATVVAKEYEAPLNIASLAAVTGLAGFFRSVGFVWMCSKFRHQATSELGHMVDLTVGDIPDGSADKILLAGGDIRSRDSAIAWMQDALADFMPQ